MNTNDFSRVKDAQLIYFYMRKGRQDSDLLFEIVCNEIASRGLETRENLGGGKKIYFACGSYTLPSGSRVLSNAYLSNRFIYLDNERGNLFKIGGALIFLDAIQSVEIFPHLIKGCLLILKHKGENIITTEYIVPNILSTWVSHFESLGIPVKDSRK